MFCRSLFVLLSFFFLLLCCVLPFTNSNYPFGIFKLKVSSCSDLFILCDVQASSLADLCKFINLIATGRMVWLNVLNGSIMCLTVTILLDKKNTFQENALTFSFG